jgi:HEAT repeat protein
MFNNRLVFAALAATLLLVPLDVAAQQPLPAEGTEAELLELLQSDAEIFDKAKACQRLAIIGTSKSVPVLAGLLADEKLSHYARFGLESNPSADVDEAFREALGELAGAPLIGVINSIGVRRDARAVGAVIKASSSDDRAVAAAAISALGAIASPESVAALLDTLGNNDSMRVTTADASLTAADLLLVGGKSAEAAQIFAALREADLPKHIDVASRFGEIRAGSGDVRQLMTQYLSSEDNDLFRIGLELAHGSPGNETTQKLVEQLASLPIDRRALLIYVLGSRRDSSALPAVVASAKSDSAEIQIAAIEVLGTLGDRSVVPILLDAAASGETDVSQTARESLAELNDDGVDAMLTEKLARSDGPERVALVDAVGRRGISDSIPSLLSLMAADDSQLRNAAIEALGLTVGARELPQMVDRLIASNSAESTGPLKDALRKACQRMPDRDAAASVLLDRMSSASPAAKAELLDLLIYVGGAKALDGIGVAANSVDDGLADSATQALGKWLTPDVAPVLLTLAKSGNQKYRTRCLRGYIRVIRQFGLKSNQRLQMSKSAFKAATRDEERKLVLDTLTRFPSVAALRMITPHLSNPTLKEDASKAAVVICESIVNTNREVVAAAMPDVLAATSDPEVTSRAKVVIAQAKPN